MFKNCSLGRPEFSVCPSHALKIPTVAHLRYQQFNHLARFGSLVFILKTCFVILVLCASALMSGHVHMSAGVR